MIFTAICLLVNLRHNLVAQHLGVQDAVESAVFGGFSAQIFLLVDQSTVIVFEGAKHELKTLEHRGFMLDESHDIFTKLLLNVIEVLVDEVDYTCRRHFDLE